jgi:hypothetical protein
VAARQLPENGFDHVQEIARRTLAAPLVAEEVFAQLFVLDWMQKHTLVALGATACKNQNEEQITVLALTWRTLVWACIFVTKKPRDTESITRTWSAIEIANLPAIMLVFAFGSVRALTRRHEEGAQLPARTFRGGARAKFVKRGMVAFAFAEDARLQRVHCGC